MTASFKKFAFPLIILLIISTDQLSKHLIKTSTCNKGIAFGLGQGITLVVPIVLIVILISLRGQRDQLTKAGLWLIFAGGVSNLADRLVFGCVRDFVKIGIFPAFNLADTVITVGVLAIVYRTFKKRFVWGLDT